MEDVTQDIIKLIFKTRDLLFQINDELEVTTKKINEVDEKKTLLTQKFKSTRNPLVKWWLSFDVGFYKSELKEFLVIEQKLKYQFHETELEMLKLFNLLAKIKKRKA